MSRAAAFSYRVLSPTGEPRMSTEYENLRYPPEVEAAILEAGYRIVINGRRLTKKEAAERTAQRKKK